MIKETVMRLIDAMDPVDYRFLVLERVFVSLEIRLLESKK